MMKIIIILIFILLVPALNAEETNKKKIDYSDLNSKYEIIGPLNVPLGQLVNIEATAIPDPGKGFSNWLKVTRVNGEKLQEAVKIHYDFFSFSRGVKTLTPGESYRLRVFQNGRMIGTPHQVMKETALLQTYGYHFFVWLVIIEAKGI